ncbi:DMT family transporter [Salinibacillus xinjiangensis]|uniref:QacE family quaternary ammonium compound efflux SMR transporter n=1 Tax=Salinibacillus xinjiangensis TaxID=1229268 RepID=A0A6G1X7J2_9BACI|nr:multidrug efflux SMR transporter [Salinibacillus xinjiangensis]MRG86876.1 QacE family quaternary ammonium compound efflux SMR transporter [Salinibacillus xinjiangensis]
MAWFWLILAGLFEMIGVTMINVLHKQQNWLSLVLLIGGFGSSFLFLTLAMETLSMSTAYAIWTGIGATGAAVVGMVFYEEPAEWKRLGFIILVIGSTVGLKLVA